MKLTAKSSFQNPKPGTVSAVCTKIIDMGSQAGNFGTKRELWIFWELSQKMTDGRPFIVKKSYAMSVHPMSNLGKDLKSWLGRDLTTEESSNFDIKSMLSKPAILTLVESGDYVNVATVSGILDGMQPLLPEGALVFFDLDHYDEAIYAGLSEKIRLKIAETDEYKLATGEAFPPSELSTGPVDDSIPF